MVSFFLIYLPGWVSIERPAFVQYIVGNGCPSAWQRSVIGLLTIPMISLLPTVTTGGTNTKNKKNVKRQHKIVSWKRRKKNEKKNGRKKEGDWCLSCSGSMLRGKAVKKKESVIMREKIAECLPFISR